MICNAICKMELPVRAEVFPVAEPVATTVQSDELVENLFGLPFSVTGSQTTPNSTNLFTLISKEFADKLDLHEMLSRILNLTVNYVGAASGSIVVLDDKGEVIDGALAYAGQIQDKLSHNLSKTTQHGLAGWVIENRQPALVDDTAEDPRWLPRDGEEQTTEFSRSAICVPLITQDRVVGVLTLTRMQSKRFTMEDLSLLTTITLTLSYSFNTQSVKRQSEKRKNR
jgi:GAF domain-containing protein